MLPFCVMLTEQHDDDDDKSDIFSLNATRIVLIMEEKETNSQ